MKIIKRFVIFSHRQPTGTQLIVEASSQNTIENLENELLVVLYSFSSNQNFSRRSQVEGHN
jgi:hypothetical protein